MSQPDTCTQREFARLLGYKPSYVTQLKAAGRLVMASDGRKVCVAASLAKIRETADPSKAPVAERHAQARAASAAAAPPGGEGEGDDELPTTSGYSHWRERTERAKALAGERENAKEEGRLYEANAVDAAIAGAVTQLRTTLEGLPYDLAPELAPITDEGELRARLVEAMELTLGELSRSFSRATQAEAA